MEIEPKKLETNFIPEEIESNIVPTGIGSVMKGGVFQSPNFSKGNSGWQVDAEGNVEFNNGTFNNVNLGALFYNKRYIYTAFDSIDGWTKYFVGTGTAGGFLGEMQLQTTAATNDLSDIHCEVAVEGEAVNFSKNPYFQTSVKFGYITNQVGFFINGGTEDSFGFKVTDGTLVAVWYKTGTEYTSAITGITLTNWNTYKAVYTSGSKIDFYVNDILKATATTNLPVATDSAERFRYQIKTTTTALKLMWAQYLLLNQDL